MNDFWSGARCKRRLRRRWARCMQRHSYRPAGSISLASSHHRSIDVIRHPLMATALIATGALAAAQTAAEIVVFAAGSLRAALTETAAAFEREQAGCSVRLVFGASGLLKDGSPGTRSADVFASANMEHPRGARRRRQGCKRAPLRAQRDVRAGAPKLDVSSETLVERMLDPAIKLGTSTPKADPSGDYAFEMFERIGQQAPRRGQGLSEKALQLTGGPQLAAAAGRQATSMACWSPKDRPTCSSPTARMRPRRCREAGAEGRSRCRGRVNVGAELWRRGGRARRPASRRFVDFLVGPGGPGDPRAARLRAAGAPSASTRRDAFVSIAARHARRSGVLSRASDVRWRRPHGRDPAQGRARLPRRTAGRDPAVRARARTAARLAARQPPEEREFLLPESAAGPKLGRITGRGNTANLEAVLALKPDLIVDAGSTRQHLRRAGRARAGADRHSLRAARRALRARSPAARGARRAHRPRASARRARAARRGDDAHGARAHRARAAERAPARVLRARPGRPRDRAARLDQRRDPRVHGRAQRRRRRSRRARQRYRSSRCCAGTRK